MERSLLRLLRFSSIHFYPIGPMVSYHGMRQPAGGSIQAILSRIKQEQYTVWHYLTDGGRLFAPVAVPVHREVWTGVERRQRIAA